MKSLIAFEAVARHCSIVKAADEMSLTSSALSKQIQALENQLGIRLFNRSTRHIALTEQGQKFAKTVKSSLKHLRESIEDMVPPARSNTLRLAAPSGFISYSLVPRLAEFKAAYPQAAFSFTSHPGVSLPDFEREPIDAAILLLCDTQVPAEIELDPIFEGCYLQPVCAPSLLPDGLPFSTVEQLAQCTWLKNRAFATMWDYWLAQAGASHLVPREVCWFDDGPSMFQAAAAGMGVAVAGGASGGPALPHHLTPAHALRAHTDVANYFLVYPRAHGRQPMLRAFRKWLLDIYSPSRRFAK